MKVALVIKNFSLNKGGAERYACLLGRGLVERGHEVHVLANQWDNAGDSGIQFHHVPMVRWNSLLKILSFPFHARKLLQENNYDIIQGLTPLYSQDVYRIGEGLHVDALLHRYPSFFARFSRYLNPKHLAVLAIERNMFKPANYRKVIANSLMCKRRLKELYGVPDRDVEVIYNGVDTRIYNGTARQSHRLDVRNELGFKEDDRVMLFVSMDFVRKGLEYLLKAHARLHREGARSLKTLVVGKGRVAEFQRMADQLGIGDLVRFLPPTNETQRYYAAADIFALPTLYDPFSNVCLEALACGLPVVTTRHNGASEIIQDGVTGYVIEHAADIDALSKAIILCLPGDVCADMGRRAAEMASVFTVERNVEQVEQVYKEIAGARHASPKIVEQKGALINQAFLHLLERNGLAGFDEFMDYSGGDSFKDISHRSVARICIPDDDGRMRTFYLKRHREKRRMSAASGGLTEWSYILKFREQGIPTMMPVAAGERIKNGIMESFLITEALEGFQRMEIFMRDRYRQPLSGDLITEKRHLVRKMADLTRKMHHEGFNHRDFYLTHTMVKPLEGRKFDLRIIDLQRVQEHRGLFSLWRRRWLIKDLASLNFAAKKDYTTRADRLRFYLAYMGKYRPDSKDRAFIKAIVTKTARIDSHDSSATAKKIAYTAQAAGRQK